MTSLSGRSIELWVEARDGVAAVNPIMQALLADLAAAGGRMSVRVPEHEVIDAGRPPERPADLVLLKTATSLALSLAVADEAHGVRCLNSARATIRASDKAAVMACLAANRVPVPATFLVASETAVTTPSTKGPGAWITKPVRGLHGRGVTVSANFPTAVGQEMVSDELPTYVVDDGTRLVQRHVGGGAPDLKVYVAGEQCFAGRKAFSPTSYATDQIEPIELDQTLRKLMQAIGGALKLRCFGVDVRFREDEPFVIDVNAFPGYRGFPAAVSALRSEVERALEPADR